MFEDLKEPVMPMPTRVKAPKDAIDEDKADLKTLHDARIKLWVQQNDDLTQVMKSLYTIVYGQCTPLMKASLTSDKTFEQIKADCDVVKLLKLIRGICFRFDSTVNPYESLDEAMKQWQSIRQGKDESSSDYYHCFIASSNDSYGFTVESNLKQMPDTKAEKDSEGEAARPREKMEMLERRDKERMELEERRGRRHKQMMQMMMTAVMSSSQKKTIDVDEEDNEY